MYRHFIFIILLSSVTLSGQTLITGEVSDAKGNLLPGANIFLKGTYDGASAGADGSFRFTTTETGEQTLIISMLGFEEFSTNLNCQGKPLEVKAIMKEAFNKLQAVEISAGAMEASDEKRSVVFKPLDIVTTAGALGDVVGALNTLPGTSANSNDGRLLVRGGSADETAIFFDGLKVNNAYGSSVSGIPTRTRFSPQLFQGTFFSTGGYSAEYGQALSSVLALNTLDMPLRDQTDISLMSVGASISHTEVMARDAFTVNGGYTNLAPYMTLAPQNLTWEKHPESYNLEGLYRHQLGKRSLLKFYYTYQASELLVYQSQPAKDQPLLQGVRNRFNYANASIRHAFNDQWLLKGGVSYSHNNDQFTLDSINPQRSESLIHLKARLTWFASDRLQLHTGVEHYDQVFSEALEGAERSVAKPLFADHLEAQYFFTEQLTVKTGLRLEVQPGQTHLMPRFSAAYQLADHHQVSVAYGDFYQNQALPMLIQQPDLDQSRSQHLLANYQWSANDRTLRAEVFHKDYQGLLQTPRDEDLNSIGQGYAYGIDVFYRDQKSIKNLDFWLTYSFIRSQRQYGTYTEMVQPSFAPTHNFSAVGKYWISKLKSQAGLTWQVNDGYTYDNPNLEGVMESKTESYASLNLNWSYLPKPNLIIHLAVNNVLGRQNVFGYNYAQDPNADGRFAGMAVQSPADRFFFVGVFITLSENKKANQLNNL